MNEKKNQTDSWYQEWFNEDYLKLYANRSLEEARYQIDFIESSLDLNSSERVLDIGCGTGRHSLALAEKGYDVVGLDLSHTLIECAKIRLIKNLSATFIEGDIRDQKELGLFDLAINMFTSFGYDDKDEKNLDMLKVIRRYLKQDGKFFLDYLNPHYVIENLTRSELKHIDGEEVRISRTIKGDMVIKTIEFPDRTYQERVKLYKRHQIESILNKAGFTIIDVWSDYNGDKWHESGARQLFYAKNF